MNTSLQSPMITISPTGAVWRVFRLTTLEEIGLPITLPMDCWARTKVAVCLMPHHPVGVIDMPKLAATAEHTQNGDHDRPRPPDRLRASRGAPTQRLSPLRSPVSTMEGSPRQIGCPRIRTRETAPAGKAAAKSGMTKSRTRIGEEGRRIAKPPTSAEYEEEGHGARKTRHLLGPEENDMSDGFRGILRKGDEGKQGREVNTETLDALLVRLADRPG